MVVYTGKKGCSVTGAGVSAVGALGWVGGLGCKLLGGRVDSDCAAGEVSAILLVLNADSSTEDTILTCQVLEEERWHDIDVTQVVSDELGDSSSAHILEGVEVAIFVNLLKRVELDASLEASVALFRSNDTIPFDLHLQLFHWLTIININLVHSCLSWELGELNLTSFSVGGTDLADCEDRRLGGRLERDLGWGELLGWAVPSIVIWQISGLLGLPWVESVISLVSCLLFGDLFHGVVSGLLGILLSLLLFFVMVEGSGGVVSLRFLRLIESLALIEF